MFVALPRITSFSHRFAPSFVHQCHQQRCIQAIFEPPPSSRKSRSLHVSVYGLSTFRVTTCLPYRGSVFLSGLQVRQPLKMFSSLERLETTSNSGDSKGSDIGAEYRIIYRFPFMKFLRVLSRLKLVQTLFTVGIAPPAAYLFLTGQITQGVAVYSIAVATFALMMLYAMSFFLRRVIGFIYLHRDRDRIKIAHLTFWGKRQEVTVPVSDVVPIAEVGEKTSELLLSLKRYSTNNKMYLSLRYGQVTNRRSFCEVFGDI